MGNYGNNNLKPRNCMDEQLTVFQIWISFGNHSGWSFLLSSIVTVTKQGHTSAQHNNGPGCERKDGGDCRQNGLSILSFL